MYSLAHVTTVALLKDRCVHCASLNHCKRVKAELSKQIPHKLDHIVLLK